MMDFQNELIFTSVSPLLDNSLQPSHFLFAVTNHKTDILASILLALANLPTIMNEWWFHFSIIINPLKKARQHSKSYVFNPVCIPLETKNLVLPKSISQVFHVGWNWLGVTLCIFPKNSRFSSLHFGLAILQLINIVPLM